MSLLLFILTVWSKARYFSATAPLIGGGSDVLDEGTRLADPPRQVRTRHSSTPPPPISPTYLITN